METAEKRKEGRKKEKGKNNWYQTTHTKEIIL